MRNFQNTFEIPKRSFISGFSICMTVPLRGGAHFREAVIKYFTSQKKIFFRVNTVFPNILLFILAYYVGLSYFSTQLRNFKIIFRRGWDSNPRGQSPMD